MAAQHRTDRNRSALIGAIILTVIAVIAVVAALVYLAVKDRDSNSDAAAGAGDCAQGELIIPVAEQHPVPRMTSSAPTPILTRLSRIIASPHRSSIPLNKPPSLSAWTPRLPTPSSTPTA